MHARTTFDRRRRPRSPPRPGRPRTGPRRTGSRAALRQVDSRCLHSGTHAWIQNRRIPTRSPSCRRTTGRSGRRRRHRRRPTTGRRIRHDDQETPALELVRIGTRALRAHLAGHAVARRLALVAAVLVHAAHLPDGAIAVVGAVLLDPELAYVEQPVARHTDRAARTVARRRIHSVLAALEGAHERRVAVAVDVAAVGQRGAWGARVRARHQHHQQHGASRENAAERKLTFTKLPF